MSHSYSPLLGLEHDSGWSTLSHGHGERTGSREEDLMLDYGAIEAAVVEDFYGGRKRGPLAKKSRGQVRARRAKRIRDQVPAPSQGGYAPIDWQGDPLSRAQQAEAYEAEELIAPPVMHGSGTDAFDAEFDAVLAEDDAYESEDQYGAWYGGSPSRSAAPPSFQGPVAHAPHGYGGHGYGGHGFGASPPVLVQQPPPSNNSPFMDSMKMGAGVGIGFLGVVIGANLLFGGGRK